jgi:hypothetical protein
VKGLPYQYIPECCVCPRVQCRWQSSSIISTAGTSRLHCPEEEDFHNAGTRLSGWPCHKLACDIEMGGIVAKRLGTDICQ